MLTSCVLRFGFQWKTSDSSHVRFLNACIMRSQNAFPLTFIIPRDYLFSGTRWSLKRHLQPLFITWVKHKINQQTSKSADANPHIVNGRLWALHYIHKGKRKKLSNDSFRCPLGSEPLKNLTDGSSDVDDIGQACSTLMCCGQLRKNFACMLTISKSTQRMKNE